MSSCRYAHIMNYVAFCWQTSLAQITSTLADVAWRRKMYWSPCRCRHTMTNTCRSSLMLYSNGQYRLPDVHMSCQICAGLGWYCLPLNDIACQKYTSLGWWCLQLLTSFLPNLCTHATDYVCMIGMMLFTIVRRHLPNMHKQHQMREDLNWCCLLLDDVT